MIEQLMKTVKRGNKKRGKNITIGAVVGFLLSCTGVIKAADEYLWIRENNGTIEFNTTVTTDDNGTDGNWSETHPYSDKNSWNTTTKTYINNMTLLSSGNNGNIGYDISYGLRLSGNLNGLKFINNGLITVTGNDYGYGIFNNGEIGTVTNSGSITVTGNDYGYGIINYSEIGALTNSGSITGIGIGTGNVSGSGIINYSKIGALTNSGSITGTGSYEGYGIVNYDKIGTLTNSGSIKGTGNVSGYGIFNNGEIGALTNSGSIKGTGNVSGSGIINYSKIGALTNSGSIKGTGNGYGIFNNGEIGVLTNTGVIYGKDNAISNEYGSINSASNYGILVNGSGNDVISGLDIVDVPTEDKNKILNYGLIIKNGSEIVSGSGEEKEVEVPIEYNDDGSIKTTRNMTIKNNIDGSSSFTGNESDVILNALTDTYKAGAGTSEITDSIINAYGTAVKFADDGGELILSGTIVNSGIDGSSIIAGSDNKDILTLENESVVNGNIDMGAESDVLTIASGGKVNGIVNMGAGNDTLNIVNGGKVNGILDGGSGSDILNFNSPVTRTSNNDEINIQHNITGFENMNINTNVTLFETTVGSDGNSTGLKVTDAGNITIGANGVLTLRIDSANKTDNKIVGHALYGNNGTISSTDGGKLLLALNGAGVSEVISFGDLDLDGSLVTGNEALYQEDVTFGTTSLFHSVKRVDGTNNEVEVTALSNLPLYNSIHGYEKLNRIYQGIISVDELENFNVTTDENFSSFLGYLNDIYAGNPYSYSSELSRKSMGMFRDIVTENQFKADTGKWMIYGGLTHIDGGTKDTYYGKGYYTYDIGSSNIEADTKITGAYMLGEYGVSDTLTAGIVIGGNKLKSDLSNDSKVDGDALYMGAYAKKYVGNLKVTAGVGFQYGDYDTDRIAVNKVASDETKAVMKYSDNYNDMTYDIYLNGRYSNPIGENLFLEPYGTLSYTYIDQDGANEGNKTLAIETDSKSFDYTSAKVGVDLKKVIPHEKGKSTLSAGVSYTRLLSGADEEYITGRFKGGSDFDILVAHKNEHSIGLNAKYTLELESGMLFDLKGTYAVERDSHNGTGKNKIKGEWIVGAGLGYKF